MFEKLSGKPEIDNLMIKSMNQIDLKSSDPLKRFYHAENEN